MTRTTWAVRDKLDRAETATHTGLMDAALRVFGRLGFARTTIADITREAGVGRATFYVYFASKEQAFAAVAERVRDRLLAAQELGDLDPDDIVAVAHATNTAYLAAYAEHLHFLTVLDHQALADPAMAELREEIHARPISRATRWIQHLVDEGLADPAGPAEVVALAGGALVREFARILAEHPEREESLGTELTHLYLRLLGVSPGENG